MTIFSVMLTDKVSNTTSLHDFTKVEAWNGLLSASKQQHDCISFLTFLVSRHISQGSPSNGLSKSH